MFSSLSRFCLQSSQTKLWRIQPHTKYNKLAMHSHRYLRLKYFVYHFSKNSFQRRGYVIHWEKEELPGTSKDPQVIAYNQEIRDCIDCEDFETAKTLLKEMEAKRLLDTQSYVLWVELLRKQHERYIAAGNPWPPESRTFPKLEIGIWNAALRGSAKLEDANARMEEVLQRMRAEKAKPDTETMNILCDFYGEERGKQIVQELLKNAE